MKSNQKQIKNQLRIIKEKQEKVKALIQQRREKISKLEEQNRQLTEQAKYQNDLIKENEEQIQAYYKEQQEFLQFTGENVQQDDQQIEDQVKETLNTFLQQYNIKEHQQDQNEENSYTDSEDIDEDLKLLNMEEQQNNYKLQSFEIENLENNIQYAKDLQKKKNNTEIQNSQKKQEHKQKPLIIKTIYNQTESKIQLPADVKKFKDLAKMLAPYYKCSVSNIFFQDECDNIFLDSQDLKQELITPLQYSVKNTYPIVKIQIINCTFFDSKLKQSETVAKQEDINLQLYEETNQYTQREIKKLFEKQQKETKWQRKRQLYQKIKSYIENCFFFLLVIFFIINTAYQDNDLVKNNLNTSLREIYEKNNINSFEDAINLIIKLAYNYSEPETIDNYPNMMLKKGVIIQKRYKENESCQIQNKIHKQFFENSNRVCLFLDQENINAFGDYKYKKLQKSERQGFIQEFYTDKQKIKDAKSEILEWVDFQTQKIDIIVNFYNANENMLTQYIIELDYLYSDGTQIKSDYFVYTISLAEKTSGQKTRESFLIFFSVVLLILIIIDYIGIYGLDTEQPNVKKYRENKEQQKKQLEKFHQKIKLKKSQTPEDTEQLKQLQKRVKDEENFIFKQKNKYILIKRPQIIEIINLAMLILIIAQVPLIQNIKNKLQNLDIKSSEYVSLDEIISQDIYIANIQSINIILLMASITWYLGKWNFNVKVYIFTLKKFFQEAWVLVLFIVILLSIVSVAWIVIVHGDIERNYSFIYVILILLKGTFYSGPFVQLKEERNLNSSQENIIYSPYTQILLYFLQVFIHFSIFSILAAIMSKHLYVQRKILIQKEENRKEQQKQQNFNEPQQPKQMKVKWWRKIFFDEKPEQEEEQQIENQLKYKNSQNSKYVDDSFNDNSQLKYTLQ